jgi:hypothetical protein
VIKLPRDLDPNHHLYARDAPCWVVHLADQDTDDELPHYTTYTAAARAATVSDRWWNTARAVGEVLDVVQLDAPCLTGRCADCGALIEDEPRHYLSWAEVAGHAHHADRSQLECSWTVDHDTRQVWCSHCKVTRNAASDPDATDRVWPGPPARGLSVNVLHLLPGHLVFISPHLLAVVTARTTAWYRDPTATVQTDRGDYTVLLPCLARRVV